MAIISVACSAGGSTPAATGTSSTPGASSTPSPTATVASARPTSCSVVTRAEAGAALGQPVKAPILGHATVEGGKACVFYGPSVPPGTSPNVPVADSVRVVLVLGADARKWFDNYRSTVHAQSIAGLGDQAFYDGYASLSVLKGDAYLRVAVGVTSNLKPEEALARDALPRM